uniref:Uncharacterized protein n=1 Tax=Zooxanthella nutricula TaxID=1333877 RepID=A0A7S2JA65_9DINO
MCKPDGQVGGMYCTRQWSGVCQPCWIPGTVKGYPDRESQPPCPYGVLGRADYRDNPASKPRCASGRARDLCCLYESRTCGRGERDPLPLDDDGYAIAAALQNTSAMLAFARRVAEQKLHAVVVDAAGLEEVASWQWGDAPKLGRTLRHLEAAMLPYLRASKTLLPSRRTTGAVKSAAAGAGLWRRTATGAVFAFLVAARTRRPL